tara:strand:- start:4197 stop:4481 length:285 start_codon:yes stop_codon:yes gene_type:complete
MPECKLGKVHDDGYDPRGSSTDYYKARCITCDASVRWGVSYRDDYSEEWVNAQSRLKDFCCKPEAVLKREKAKTVAKIAELESKLKELMSISYK